MLKQTFDTEEKITITPSGIDEREAKLVINPYDEYALEEALRQRELLGGQVIVVTCGSERSQEALRTALAIGADEAVRVDNSALPDDGFAVAAALAAVIAPLQPDLLLAGLFAVDSGAGSVALQVAQRLGLPHASAAIKVSLLTPAELAALPSSAAADQTATEHHARPAAGSPRAAHDAQPADGSLGAERGKQPATGSPRAEHDAQPVDGSSGAERDTQPATGSSDAPAVAAIPSAERYALVERDIEGDTETVVLPLPALITAQQGLNEPRYPSLPGIMKAKRKPLRIVAPDELAQLGRVAPALLNGAWKLSLPLGNANEKAPSAFALEQTSGEGPSSLARTVQTQLSPPPPRAVGKQLSGAPAEQATKLVALLRSEAKLL
jgi:electron transfer flavoprotein beta subunit